MKYELKDYSFGQTIGKGFGLYRDNLVLLIFTSLVISVPVAYLEYLQNTIETAGSSNILYNIGIIFGKFLVQALLSVLLSGLVIIAVSDKYLENEYSLKKVLRKSINILLPLFGLMALMFLASVVPAGLIVLTAYLHWGLTVILSVPYFIFLIMFSLGLIVAPHALILEGTGIIESFSRSWRLTRGFKGWILGIIIVLLLIEFGIGLFFGIAIGLMSNYQANHFTMGAMHILGAVLSPINACVYVVIYFNLRIKKEAFNVEHLAQQFDRAGKGLSADII